MTLDRDDLTAAVAAQIITTEQAEKLAAFEAERREPEEGEEELRFIRNFHDVFLAIGVGLFAIGLFIAAQLIPPRWAAAIAGALILWALAEFLIRRGRLALPGIVVAISFFAMAANALQAMPAPMNQPYLVTGILFLLAAGFYARFRLPFSMALVGAFGVAAALLTLHELAPQVVGDDSRPILLISGFALFALALFFDARDPQRRKRFSDNAFWLHLLAAPLIVHGIMISLFGGEDMNEMFDLEAASAAVLLGVVLVIALTALLINRRAILVSALGYSGIAIAVLVNRSGMEEGFNAAAVLLLLGAAVVALGVGWNPMRRALFGWLPFVEARPATP